MPQPSPLGGGVSTALQPSQTYQGIFTPAKIPTPLLVILPLS